MFADLVRCSHRLTSENDDSDTKSLCSACFRANMHSGAGITLLGGVAPAS